MGFNLESVVSNVQYVGTKTNTGKNGQTYTSTYFLQEDEHNINLLRLSVPSEKIDTLYDARLTRGEFCTVAVRAIAGDGYNYMQFASIISRDGAVDAATMDY